jgi:predicted TIM-barrel fold metal-dependent hydrolase
MSTIDRIVDAHVHHWSPRRADLFPFLVDEEGLKKLTGLPDVSRLRRDFDGDTLREESAGWNVVKYVHVSAAMGPDVSYVAETLEREEQATRLGRPDAVVGSVHAGYSPAAIVDELAAQAEAGHFRGVRVNMGIDHTSEQARVLLRELQDRELSYEMWIHPPDMKAAADVIAEYGDLPVVIGHMGWPLATDGEHFALWQQGMAALAAVGPRVHCKLSGLVGPVGRYDDEAFRPWIDFAIDTFGDERCLFASNFPPDGSAGTYDELFGLYDRLTSTRDDAARARLFAGNAERFYRI